MLQKIIMGKQVPVMMWADEVDDRCMQNILARTALPYAFKHLAIMADVHAIRRMSIDGVLATRDVIVPDAVGMDIGCGVCAMETSVNADELDRKKIIRILRHIRETIPMGYERRRTTPDEWSDTLNLNWDELPNLKHYKESVLRNLGTLGGGSHFIELQRDVATGHVWVMIHSGSLYGDRVAWNYMRLHDLKSQYEDSYFKYGAVCIPIDTQDAHDYMAEMEACVEIGFTNRTRMLWHVFDGLEMVAPGMKWLSYAESIHNYAAREHHYGEDVIVHRKGAISARKGEKAVIPGSLGTKSYIVEGKGRPESFNSCGRGAGRILRRDTAYHALSLMKEKNALDKKGVIYSLQGKGLGEAPGAFKDIDHILDLEDDLVKPIVELVPIANIKGDYWRNNF